MTGGMAEPEIPRDELQAALRARGELDRELEPHVIDAFLDRVERSIDARVDARVEARIRASVPERASDRPRTGGGGSIFLALGSIGLGIGATGAANGMGGSEGVIVAIVAWIAIALINIANAVHR
jgi:hypothetical protein